VQRCAQNRSTISVASMKELHVVSDSTSSVSAHPVAGVWSRQWEEDPLDSGVFDRETLVHWTQAPCGLYVDIRLPRDSPGRSLDAAIAAGVSPNPVGLIADGTLGELSVELHAALLKQSSFAGQLHFSVGDTTTSGAALEKDATLAALSKQETAAIGLALCTCYWQRHVDYRPPSGGLDVGVCCASGPLNDQNGTVEMRETGEDASYAEGWKRLAGTYGGPFVALELVEDNGVPRQGYWVRTGDRFAYAVGRPVTEDAVTGLKCELGSNTIVEKVGKSLAEATADQDQRTALRQVLSYVAVTGKVQDNGAWTIESSTRPDLVGCTLLDRKTQQESSRLERCCSTLFNRVAMTTSQLSPTEKYVSQHVGEGTSGEGSVRVWRIVELVGCELPFEA
jgi:hypothetical protein